MRRAARSFTRGKLGELLRSRRRLEVENRRGEIKLNLWFNLTENRLKILITSGLAYLKDGPVKGANIGVNESRVEAITKEIPPDFEDAELQIGGKDRIVSPGFVTTHTYLSLYPFRYSLVSGKLNVNDLVSVLTPKDIYSLSLLASYHLLRSGVTAAVTADPSPESAARAMMSVGLKPFLAVGVGCNWGPSDWKREFKVLRERWGGPEGRVLLKICDQQELEEALHVASEARVPVLLDRLVTLEGISQVPNYTTALGGGSRQDLEAVKRLGAGLSFLPSMEVCKFTLGSFSPSISLDASLRYDARVELGFAISRLTLTPDEAFKALTSWGYQALGIKGSLEVGAVPDLVVFQVGEPPSYPLDRSSPYETLIFSTGVPETVIVGGEPVLDGGVPLNVGIKDIEEAEEVVQEIAGKRISSLEKG
ncbi:amidohydrolase family protein [Metallosphaera yellowstonensis]|uniref:amidohydrolase family protein n=1 Tax=Metallosphaera yellowstonensis TaxID=1111107 RepID=UPI000A953FF7|nr:amidohydrolase family protein [Metallosphaera yellowstonensis]